MIPWLQNLVLKDFWLKLFSFALASLIWFTVHIAIKNDISPVASLSLAPTDQIVFRDLPIVVLTPANQVGGCTINPKTATVTLQGDSAELRNLRRQDIRLLVDLSDPGVSNDSRKRVEVTAPAGIAHVRVDPQEVQVVNEAKN
jgi:YbbR domain-containing protein